MFQTLTEIKLKRDIKSTSSLLHERVQLSCNCQNICQKTTFAHYAKYDLFSHESYILSSILDSNNTKAEKTFRDT